MLYSGENANFFAWDFPYPVKSIKAEEVKTRSLVAAAGDDYSCEFGSSKYYALCAVGGALSCGLTHTAVTPLDLVKCRLQVSFVFFSNLYLQSRFQGQ